MNLYDDESLKQEVIYLHSLWHQGPPTTRNPIPTPNFNPIQRPRPNYIPPADFQLLSRYGSRNPKRSRPGEWPVDDPPRSSPATTGWPEPRPCKKARPLSESEKAKLAVSQIQREVHRACREFFVKRSDDDGDDDGEEEEVRFLSGVFEENAKLKECYEKNTVEGEVWCLVCGGSGEKSVRKFKNCLALVQHSLAIHKTMKNQHRALAQVVCNVLGWDVNNPVGSSQKDSQALVGVEAVAEGGTELLPDLKKLQEKQHVMSSDEQAKAAVLQMQQNASEALKGISVKETDGSVENGDEQVFEELGLISQLFSENVELKSYYEKNSEGGHFVCLVCCAATDKKMIKRFKHCHGLVLHCTKTPKIAIRTHEAFARFVCGLFGWEFDHLPRRVVKGGGVPLVECSADQNSEKPSLMIEDASTTNNILSSSGNAT